MKIEILGSGCSKCKKQYEIVQQAIEQSGIEATVEKVEDINTISRYGIFMTPALVVDGEVKSSGKILKLKEVLDVLQQ